MIPYPLRAAKISIDLQPFGFWWKPQYRNFHLFESAKENGQTQWYVRFAWFQISYSRWI